MIDSLDKQTQSLPIEQSKRGRGRPKTGEAKTRAEIQRAYRERQKPASSGVTVNSDVLEEAERLREKVQHLLKEVKVLSKENRELRTELKSQKTVTNSEPGNGIWTLRFKVKGSRKWDVCEPQIFNGVPWGFKLVAEHVQEMQKGATGTQWQAVRDDGLIYDPKAAK